MPDMMLRCRSCGENFSLERCPGCGESDSGLVEWDKAQRLFFCSVCATTWRRDEPNPRRS